MSAEEGYRRWCFCRLLLCATFCEIPIFFRSFFVVSFVPIHRIFTILVRFYLSAHSVRAPFYRSTHFSQCKLIHQCKFVHLSHLNEMLLEIYSHFWAFATWWRWFMPFTCFWTVYHIYHNILNHFTFLFFIEIIKIYS